MAGIFFSADEILSIAVRIEENGQKFYSACADSNSDANLKKVFNYLAGEERKHKSTFEKLREKMGDYNFEPSLYTEEADLYLKALADVQVFSPGADVVKLAKETRDVVSILSLAIGAEKDSILFYGEMLELAPDENKKTISAIIREEQSHIVQLDLLKRAITARTS
jgi:rubrerythrin